MAHAWAILATIFLGPVYIGLGTVRGSFCNYVLLSTNSPLIGLSALFIVALFTLTVLLWLRSRYALGHVLQYIVPQVVDSARQHAHERAGFHPAVHSGLSSDAAGI